jgi:tetraacyldisaccharide 4'-kinase
MTDFYQSLARAWERRAPWLLLLLPLEWLFRAAVALRRCAYRWGVAQCYRAPVPVVVVGNIALGGTGKTPMIISLVHALEREGIRVGVVSRGYGRQGVDLQMVTADSDVTRVGDEPLLIVRRTGCACAVAPSRVDAVKALVERCNVQIVLSDDGLQHYALARDLEIVLYDAQTGFGSGHCLPVGPLREPLSRLRQADIVLAKVAAPAPDSLYLEHGECVNLVTGQRANPSRGFFTGTVYAYAGIAHPEAFFDALATLGIDAHGRAFRDHHAFSAQDFHDVENSTVIMTEKDAVKCTAFATPNMWYLQVNAQVPEAVYAAIRTLLTVPQSLRGDSRTARICGRSDDPATDPNNERG